MRKSNLGKAADYITSIPHRDRFVKFHILRVVNETLAANRALPIGAVLHTVPCTHFIYTNNRVESGNSQNVDERCEHPMRALEKYVLDSSRFFAEGQRKGGNLQNSTDRLALPLNLHAAERFVELRRVAAGCKVMAAGPAWTRRFYVIVKGMIFYVDLVLGECHCGVMQVLLGRISSLAIASNYPAPSPNSTSPPLSHVPEHSASE